MTAHQVAFLDAKGTRLRVGAADMPKAGPDDIVIRNHAVAVNPVDWKIHDWGFYIQSWPTILDEDVAGEIHEVGSNVKNFKKSDRVISHAVMFIRGDTKWSGFQQYTLASPDFTAKLPDSVSHAQGSVIPLALDAAAVGLFNSAEQGGLGLAIPSLKAVPSGKTIAVWGGSTSVGANAIQLAVAPGANVITTTSSKNFVFVKQLRASHVFYYNSSTVVDDVVAEVEAAGGDFAGVLDCISEKPSYEYTVPITKQTGAKQFAVVTPTQPEGLPADVKVGTVFAVSPLVALVWKDFITPPLADGILKAVPAARVVGKGLEAVQKGLDEHKVSVPRRSWWSFDSNRRSSCVWHVVGILLQQSN